MDAVLSLTLLCSMIGFWRFIAKVLHSRNFIIRHLAGITAGTFIPSIAYAIGMSNSLFLKILSLTILLLMLALGFKGPREEFLKSLQKDHSAAKDKNINDEIAKLRKIGSKNIALTPKPSYESTKPQIISNYSKGDYLIHYTDASGNYSQRTISGASKKGSNISAYCHLRNDTRTFKISRIENPVTDFNTGEIMDVKDWVKTI